jgi:hypothetical protein
MSLLLTSVTWLQHIKGKHPLKSYGHLSFESFALNASHLKQELSFKREKDLDTELYTHRGTHIPNLWDSSKTSLFLLYIDFAILEIL